jgi:acetolactate synthase-1/2/3 large subunit
MAKGLFPEDHSYFAGVLDMAGYRVIWDFLADADLILAAGFDPVELISPWGLSTPVLHLDTTLNTDQVYASEHEVVGNVAAILDWIAAHWSGEPRRTEQEVAAHRASPRQAWLAGHVPDALNPSDVVTIAREVAPPDTILVTDIGSHKIMSGQAWPARTPRGVLMINGLSAMGFGVPAAIAARLARPEHPVIALVGEAGGDRPAHPAQALGCDGTRADSPRGPAQGTGRLRHQDPPAADKARINPAQYEAQFA